MLELPLAQLDGCDCQQIALLVLLVRAVAAGAPEQRLEVLTAATEANACSG
jgi:hypothetical protein